MTIYLSFPRKRLLKKHQTHHSERGVSRVEESCLYMRKSMLRTGSSGVISARFLDSANASLGMMHSSLFQQPRKRESIFFRSIMNENVPVSFFSKFHCFKLTVFLVKEEFPYDLIRTEFGKDSLSCRFKVISMFSEFILL